MSKTTLSDLRSHLFDCIERVKSLNDKNTDQNEKMTIDQAKAICQLSSEIIESAKVEVQAMQILADPDNRDANSFVTKSGLFLTQGTK